MGNLSHARFSVSTPNLMLLSHLDFGSLSSSRSNLPLIEEFLINVAARKLRIDFVPDNKEKNSFAFINAIEVFLAPPNFVRDDPPPPRVTRRGSDGSYNGVLDFPLHVVHRINVGGGNVTRERDTMMRYWIPDDAYLLLDNTAINTVYNGEIRYRNDGGGFDAPDSVYKSAKEMNVNGGNTLTNFNISWRFQVGKGALHLVRLHFCDIVSSNNETFRFNLYIYSDFSKEVYPWKLSSETAGATPFYMDFVVDSDDSGFMNISVGPKQGSKLQTAFLNGVEIMEVMTRDSVHSMRYIIILWSIIVLVIMVMLLSLFIFCLRKNKCKNPSKLGLVPIRSHSVRRTGNGFIHAHLNLGLRVSLSSILFATREFNAELMIGEGGFGKVYRGMLRDGRKVAIKRSEAKHGQGLEEFHTEIMVLSKIRHHHLVSLFGYCDEKEEMILVYEFMEKGCLRDHLYNLQGDKSNTSQFSWDQRLKICIGAAKGLHYLHTGSSETIIHRDIKSTNILLDENDVAKVADFGLSRTGSLDQTHFSTDQVKGSFGYLDPEYFTCLQLTQKSDVYSFGVVLLEVVCARPAIDKSLPKEQVSLADWGMSCQQKGQIESIVDPFLIGKINPNSLRIFGETVEKCLQECGADRPMMSDVLWCLEHCLKFQDEDSTTMMDMSLGLPAPIVPRLPSNMSISEGEVVFRNYSFSDSESAVDASSRV